jgi:hypothetical protein
MTNIMRTAVQGGLLVATGLIASSPAIAGVTTPGPVLGAGAPALAVIAGGYWLIRRFRRG